mmetsp:Transcript_25556/g.53211  ORF Transcript_25556/g.53211 Transcript_25556/m.53211 type:complete len:257 (+) Transcript_25556:487-1257(+)
MDPITLLEQVSSYYPSYQALYQDIVQHYIRFVAPVFCMGTSLERLGQPYALHFFEPRYQYMMSEIMKDQTDAVRRGEGPVVGDNNQVCFVHAAAPLQEFQMAVWVRVLRCGLFPDGRADVLMVPIQQIWMEDIWVRPNTGGLYYAQCLRLSQRTPNPQAAVEYYRDRQQRRRRQQESERERSLNEGEGEEDAAGGRPTTRSTLKSMFWAFCFFGAAVALVSKGCEYLLGRSSSSSSTEPGTSPAVGQTSRVATPEL